MKYGRADKNVQHVHVTKIEDICFCMGSFVFSFLHKMYQTVCPNLKCNDHKNHHGSWGGKGGERCINLKLLLLRSLLSVKIYQTLQQLKL